MKNSQLKNVRDSLWCYKIQVLVHVLKRVKREKIFEKVKIINVNLAGIEKIRSKSFDFACVSLKKRRG